MTPELLQHPTANMTGAATGDGGLRPWNTPIPYLFGGLALIMGLITVALIFLACTHKNSSTISSNHDEYSDEKSKKHMHDLRPEIEEPRIVVIMAGEINPTHLAKPIATVNPQRGEV